MRPAAAWTMKSVVEIADPASDARGQSPERPGMAEAASRRASTPASDARPHILYVIDELCEMGGAERVLLNTIRLLPRDRFRCSLVTFRTEPRLGIFEDFPCPWHLFPLRRTYDWNALRVAAQIRRLIRAERVRIVHTFFETSDLWGGLVAKLSGCPILVSSRRDMGILRQAMHHRAYRLINPLFDRVLAVSEEVRAFCIQHDRLASEKVLTLYNGIETERAAASADPAALRASLGLDGASHIVSTVAHVRRVKGLDIFIQAAAAVCREFPRAVFVVIGDNHEPAHFRELDQLTDSLGLAGNVKFLGPSEQVFSLLKMSDVFCLPSRSEGFSNALVEAMACGLPCVATRVGGNAEALSDGENGFLVAPEDAAATADRILTLLRQPARAQQMGRAAREVAEVKFTQDAMMKNLVGVYERLLDAKQR
ncbi:MAG: glycosyltransferase [Acidobacteria bacterium]|nr:glycosyltransferase [Acidobacteriota bacterium]